MHALGGGDDDVHNRVGAHENGLEDGGRRGGQVKENGAFLLFLSMDK